MGVGTSVGSRSMRHRDREGYGGEGRGALQGAGSTERGCNCGGGVLWVFAVLDLEAFASVQFGFYICLYSGVFGLGGCAVALWG